MNVNKMKFALIIGLAWVVGGATSQAYDNFQGIPGYGFPWFGYGNNGPAAYALGNIPAPPYFALHPPVYYSHPVPRAYGQSPFAYSGDHHHSGRRAAPPCVMANPFIEIQPADPAATQEKAVKVAAVPLRIVNPFYSELEREGALADNDR